MAGQNENAQELLLDVESPKLPGFNKL